jgi:hypothetical protein
LDIDFDIPAHAPKSNNLKCYYEGLKKIAESLKGIMFTDLLLYVLTSILLVLSTTLFAFNHIYKRDITKRSKKSLKV